MLVDDPSGAVRESWTGHQVAWQMARGYEGQFGHMLNAPYVWMPLCLIFLLGLFDWRRPWRIVHLDLLVLLAFGVSHVLLQPGRDRGLGAARLPGARLPARADAVARVSRRGARCGRRCAGRWLAIGRRLLLAFRIALNVGDSGVIDVGYAGAIGADRIAHGEPLYGEGEFPADNRFGDTYGPVNYFAYLPFELALPWSGEWDELAASHAAAISFDLATVAGLVAFALRLRPGRPGRELAVDARLRLARLSVHRLRPAVELQRLAGRGAARLVAGAVRPPAGSRRLLALAVLAKFAPLALAPLFAAGDRGLARARASARRSRSRARLRRSASSPSPLLALAHPGDRSGPGDVLGPHGREPARPQLSVQHLGSGDRPGLAADRDPGRSPAPSPWRSPSCPGGARSPRSRPWRPRS